MKKKYADFMNIELTYENFKGYYDGKYTKWTTCEQKEFRNSEKYEKGLSKQSINKTKIIQT